MLIQILDSLDSVLYYPILMIILIIAAAYFTSKTKFIQVRYFKESCRLIMEQPTESGSISSFQALMVSTASRVGTGNIVGVSTALCLGGPGAMFWMCLMAFFGASSAFCESTLAQIYKKKSTDTGECFGGPAYYIETALHSRVVAVVFVIFMIATYGFGFNMLCSYNLQTTFMDYSFYDANVTPLVIGGIFAVLVAICLFGGGKRIVRVTEILVPVMGILYVVAALIVLFAHITTLPHVIVMVLSDAFNFRAIFGGMAGSCLVYGIKRGLYSNEAGVGSAPNASASANVSHPVKQGLVQMLSVYIDTLLLCAATAIMCLSSGIEPAEELSGAPYVQAALSTVFGSFGPIFITVAMVLFAFTTLIGNLFYVDRGLTYLNNKKLPGKAFMTVFHLICAAVVLIGAIMPMNVCWDLADITMGGMTIINIPVCIILSGTMLKCFHDYEKQKREGKDPVFRARDIGLDTKDLDYWK